jgi:glutamate--cysteine ligase catalytic subunit
LDKDNKKARLSLNAYDTLEKLQLLETEALQSGKPFQSSWKPEYGRYMLEGTPQLPFGATLADLVLVEENMAKRRLIAQSLLGPNELLVTMTSFPHLGVHNSLHPHYLPTPAAITSSSQSLFIPDAAINPHARFS